MSNNNLYRRFFYFIRNLRSKPLFLSLKKYLRGNVLDVGGGDFYLTVKDQLVYDSWTTLEKSRMHALKNNDTKYKLIIGDGCEMKLASNSFETVLCIQVLEHVFEPIKMFGEISRVLKKGGHAVILVPQTGVLHLTPYHFNNFTRFWLIEATKRNNLKIVELKSLGGFWSTIASRLFFFYFQSLGFKISTYKNHQRNIFFYILLPIMWLYALISIPICIFLSLGDLCEEPNNNLLVVRK